MPSARPRVEPRSAISLSRCCRTAAALLSRARSQATLDGHAYTRIAIGPALESAIQDLEWAFWQYYGIAWCGTVPATTATDDALWSFLDQVSGVSFSDDESTGFFDAYFHQAYAQLGSPGTVAVRGDTAPAQLVPHLMYGEADFVGALPLGEPIPVLDTAVMAEIEYWVQTSGQRLLFVYGQWDPWTGGKFQLGAAAESLVAEEPQGTHGASLLGLTPGDRDAGLAMLATWSGVTPTLPTTQRTLWSTARPRRGLSR